MQCQRLSDVNIQDRPHSRILTNITNLHRANVTNLHSITNLRNDEPTYTENLTPVIPWLVIAKIISCGTYVSRVHETETFYVGLELTNKMQTVHRTRPKVFSNLVSYYLNYLVNLLMMSYIVYNVDNSQLCVQFFILCFQQPFQTSSSFHSEKSI
jgi:hypothetical protein